MRLLFIHCFFIALLISGFVSKAQVQPGKDSAKFKNAIKLDLVSLYLDFFDTHKQVRAGFEYERTINKKSAVACLVDLGLYDDYKFIKYYDFFNQGPGLHYTRQIVQIKGIHMLPSYNYYLFQLKRKPNCGIFSGGIVDAHYYRKKFNIYDSQTFVETADKYSQITMGAGPQLGIKYGFRQRFYIEVKTCAFFKLFNIIPANGINPIMPLEAQWVNSNYSFWWVTNFKISYAF